MIEFLSIERLTFRLLRVKRNATIKNLSGRVRDGRPNTILRTLKTSPSHPSVS